MFILHDLIARIVQIYQYFFIGNCAMYNVPYGFVMIVFLIRKCQCIFRTLAVKSCSIKDNERTDLPVWYNIVLWINRTGIRFDYNRA